jgi:hypothetical protein
VRGQDLRFQRFSVTGSDASLEVTAEPAVTLLTSRHDPGQPYLAADGHRVVLAYRDDYETRLKISDDRGLHFGPYMVIGEPSFEVGGTSPTGVDALGDLILVEQSGSFGEGPGGGVDYSKGFLSTDGGDSWSETSSHSDGVSVGALFASSGTPIVAEAWDKSLAEGPTSQKLRFHMGGALP